MRRGFTLIEILVVISIIGMLSSVLVAAITPARAKARDTVRRETVRQIDLAIQLYKANSNGRAPGLGISCKAQLTAMNYSDAVSACVAISTQGFSDPGTPTPWQKLQSDLAPYMPSLPRDPCGTNCSTAFGNTLGYTYYSPAYLQSLCGSSCNGQSLETLDQNYQLSAQLESQNTQAGGSSVPQAPTITGITSPITYIEDIEIVGTGFNQSSTNAVTYWQDGSVRCTVTNLGLKSYDPQQQQLENFQCSPQLMPGTYQVTVSNSNGMSSPIDLVLTY